MEPRAPLQGLRVRCGAAGWLPAQGRTGLLAVAWGRGPVGGGAELSLPAGPTRPCSSRIKALSVITPCRDGASLCTVSCGERLRGGDAAQGHLP